MARILNTYEQKRIRIGKTARDHASGSWKQRIVNQQTRAAAILETKWYQVGKWK